MHSASTEFNTHLSPAVDPPRSVMYHGIDFSSSAEEREKKAEAALLLIDTLKSRHIITFLRDVESNVYLSNPLMTCGAEAERGDFTSPL